MDNFSKIIKSYLEMRADLDPLFAKVYRNDDKSINDCCNYIIQQVKESGREAFGDDEIYGMAVHFFDENLTPKAGTKQNCKIVHSSKNRHTKNKVKAEQEQPTLF